MRLISHPVRATLYSTWYVVIVAILALVTIAGCSSPTLRDETMAAATQSRLSPPVAPTAADVPSPDARFTGGAEEPQVFPLRTDLFQFTAEVHGEPRVAQPVTVKLCVNPVTDIDHLLLKIFPPDGLALLEGSSDWEDSPGRGKITCHEVTLSAQKPGQHTLRIYLEASLGDRHTEEGTYFLFFVSTKESGQISLTPTDDSTAPLEQVPRKGD